MDPVGSGWPYAYNRLVAATAASSGSASGNFSHLTSGGTTTAHHHTPGSVTATPLLVQPTATVPTSHVNHPYGATSFLAPPTVGYDVFSTLFHPHAAAAAQANQQAVANLKSLNYSTPAMLNQQQQQQQQQEASNSSTNSSSSSSSASQQAGTAAAQQQQQQSSQYNYQNATISRPSANIAWNTNSSNSGSGQAQQQLQFGLSSAAVNSGSSPGPASSNSSLATITRVNSNGCGSAAAAAAATTSAAMYENYNAQLKAHSLYQLNSHLANAAVMAMANKLNANRTTLTVPQPVSSNSMG